MTTKPFMILLVGAPASGKSTYAQNYVAWCKAINQPVVVLSTDDIVMRMSAENRADGAADYAADFKELIGPAQKEFDLALETALMLKVAVIVDRTNMSKKSRARFVQAGLKNGYTVSAMVFDVPEYALMIRLANRAKEPGNKVIGAHIVSSMLANYERPTEEEGFSNVIDMT